MDRVPNGYQNIHEFNLLLDLYKTLSPKRYVLEIGSLEGFTLQHWIEFADPGATVISVDLPVIHFSSSTDPRWEQQRRGHEVLWPSWAREFEVDLTVMPARSFDPETYVKVAGMVPHLDFLFVDGDHSYPAVSKDFAMYSPLVRSGGIIAMHDIGPREAGEARVFWNEIKGRYADTAEYLLDPEGRFGMGVIFKP